jgi:predicted lactoylglutathione lyase
MQHQLSVINVGVDNLARSRTFYCEGFGWTPVFENDEIAFFQMNGFVFGIWLKESMAADSMRKDFHAHGAFCLAHNVPRREDVEVVMTKLVAAGGLVVRAADEPAHGGYRGYVSDPDTHLWEIAWNPAWSMDAAGHVTFGV